LVKPFLYHYAALYGTILARFHADIWRSALMTLHPHPILPVPDATAAATEAAFPKGNPYIDLRAELGTLYFDAMFDSLFQPKGRPVEVAPWRLALVLVLQHLEGLTDRQAADAVRRCIDWKCATRSRIG
jgi:transposase